MKFLVFKLTLSQISLTIIISRQPGRAGQFSVYNWVRPNCQLCWLVICYSVVYGSYVPKSKHTNDRVSYCFFSLFPWLSSWHPECSRCHSSTLIVQDIAPSPQMSRMLLHRSNGTTRKIDPVHPEQSLFSFSFLFIWSSALPFPISPCSWRRLTGRPTDRQADRRRL